MRKTWFVVRDWSRVPIAWKMIHLRELNWVHIEGIFGRFNMVLDNHRHNPERRSLGFFPIRSVWWLIRLCINLIIWYRSWYLLLVLRKGLHSIRALRRLRLLNLSHLHRKRLLAIFFFKVIQKLLRVRPHALSDVRAIFYFYLRKDYLSVMLICKGWLTSFLRVPSRHKFQAC